MIEKQNPESVMEIYGRKVASVYIQRDKYDIIKSGSSGLPLSYGYSFDSRLQCFSLLGYRF